MLYYFKKGKNATEMQKKICAVYGEDAVTECQKWFAKFHAGDFSLDDAHGQVDQLKLTVIKLRHELRTINIIPHRRELTYSKYPNQ